MKKRFVILGLPPIAWLVYINALVIGGTVLQGKASWVHITYFVFVIIGVFISGAIDNTQWEKRHAQKTGKAGE